MSDIMYNGTDYDAFYTIITGLVDIEYSYQKRDENTGEPKTHHKAIAMSALSFSALIDEFFIHRNEMSDFVFKDVIKIADEFNMLKFPIHELVECTSHSLFLPILKSIDDGIIVNEDIYFVTNNENIISVRCRDINSIYLLEDAMMINETIDGEVYDLIINLNNLCFCKNVSYMDAPTFKR